jgi:Zn-finger nucleic acid-binding protein
MELILKCPFCKTSMNKIKRADVTVDRCPNCLGIWLDKGELDKIVQKRKKFYEETQRNWGYPHVGAIPPSEKDDVSLLVGEWG